MIKVRIRKKFPPSERSAGFTLDVDFTAPCGITVLFGPRGAGKTLVLDAIAGFLHPDEGRILLDDAILYDGATGVHLRPQRRNCGYIVPNYALFPHMSVRRNLEFAVRGLARLERRRRVRELLERYHLSEVAECLPREISAIQKLRCAIARALARAPQALLLDEPACGLEPSLRASFYSWLQQVRDEHAIPILLATHDFEECFESAGEVLMIREGKIAQSGSLRRVLEQPASVEVARMLGVFNLLPAEIRALDPSRNSSRLKVGEVELSGVYYPGRFLGDRVWLCVRSDELVAAPQNGKPGPNQMAVQLVRAVERLQTVRLEFAGGIVVEMKRALFESQKHNKEWVVEFPPGALRVI